MGRTVVVLGSSEAYLMYHCAFTIIITIIVAVEYSRPSVLDQSLDLLLLFFLH